MSTDAIISADAMARMQEAAERAAKGSRDPEQMRKACENMDRVSEEIRRRNGVLNFGVRAIRELRDT